MKLGLTKVLAQVVLAESKCLCIDNSYCSGGLCLVTMSIVSWGEGNFWSTLLCTPDSISEIVIKSFDES